MNINGYTPKGKINKKFLLTFEKYTPEEIYEILYLARKYKKMRSVGERTNALKNRYVALLTKQNHPRTYISFKMAVEETGGNTISIPMHGTDIESILKDRDTVTVMKGLGINAITVDTSEFKDAETILNFVNIPTVNANHQFSPCQTCCALLTMWERFGELKDKKLAIIGDLKQSDYSIVYGAAKCGIDISIICPEVAEPESSVINYCRQFCDIEIHNDIEDGIRGADAVYIMNHEFDRKFMVTEKHMAICKSGAIILHPMPIQHGKEISGFLIDTPGCAIYEQAQNLLPVLQSIFTLII